MPRARRYRPTELAELSDVEIARMLRRGVNPECGLNKSQVATILKRGLARLAARPGMLHLLARAVAARRELDGAARAARGFAPGCAANSMTASTQLY